MALCTALLKSEKHCTFKAKYFLKEYNEYYCKKHALSQSNLKMNTTYDSINDIDNLQEIEYQQQITEDSIGSILGDIYYTHNYKLTVVSETKNKYFNELLVADRDDLTQKYILKITKSLAYIEQLMNVSSTYASILPNITKPICVPILSYKQEDQYRLCLIRGWKYNNWYYEVLLLSYPLLMNNNKKLITRLVELIQLSHDNRIVHGSIELRNLVQLKPKRISTTVFKSLENALFWEGRYGQTVEEDASIDSDIIYDSMLCSRNLNQKKHPCRYDDYESLLFLVVNLLGNQLPWVGLTSNVDIVNEKTNFLIALSGNIESMGSAIASMIINSHYDDRPNYSQLSELFIDMLIN